MLSATIIDQGTINTTLPDPGDPTYQSEALCLFLRQQFAALRTASFQFEKAQVSDITSFQTSLSTWLANQQAREDEILADGVATTVATLPDILAIGAAYMSGGATAAIGCIVNMVMKKMFGGDQGATGSYNQAQASGSVDFDEIIAKLEEIRGQIEQVFTDYNVNIINSREDAFFSLGPPAD